MTKKLRIRVYEKYNGHCAYCGRAIQYKVMQVDHIVPLIMLKAALSWEQSNYPAAGLCSMFLQKQIIKGGCVICHRENTCYRSR